MAIEIMDGNECAALGALLSRVQAVPTFPITPQTEIIETLAKWKADGVYKGKISLLEGEHSVMAYAIGTQSCGLRTFTATSSQGLLLMHEMLPIASGMRLPLVMVNVSRALSSPITLWNDHNDMLAVRDSGFLIFVADTNQEVLDTIPMAYRVSENEKVLLPSIVNMDGFIHSFTRAEVDIPAQSSIDRFLPKLRQKLTLDTSRPMSLGTPAMSEYMFFKQQMHKAQLNSFEVIRKAERDFRGVFGRRYGLVEQHHLNDADAAVVVMGANSTIAKLAMNRLRARGFKVGMLRIRVYRPFPEKEIREALEGVGRIAVLDQNISPGLSGILYPEVKAALYGTKKMISNYIIALGGRPTSEKEFEEIFTKTLNSRNEERSWVM